MAIETLETAAGDVLASSETGLAAKAGTSQSGWPADDLELLTDRTILIVDDEPLMIAVVEDYLRNAGYRNIFSSDDAVHAMSLIGVERPDVVLLDVCMPKINGLEVLSEIRRDIRLSGVSVIVLTASTGEDVKIRSLELGATDFLQKPIQSGELLARLKNTLMAKAYQDHVRNYSQTLEANGSQRIAELQRSNEEFRNFVSVASHNLRIPLQNFSAFADGILNNSAATLPPETKTDLTAMRDCASQMDLLLDDLLMYSRSGRKKG